MILDFILEEIINDTSVSDERLLEIAINEGYPNDDAIDFISYLPIVACRYLFKEISFPNEYFEFYQKNNLKVKKNFLEDNKYIDCNLFVKRLDEEVIFKLAKRSAEYDAIRKAQEDGALIANLQVEPMIFYY